MKTIKFLPVILLTLQGLQAQNLEKSAISKEVQRAIDEFHDKRSNGNKSANEVLVVMDKATSSPKKAKNSANDRPIKIEAEPTLGNRAAFNEEAFPAIDSLSGIGPATTSSSKKGLTIRVTPLTRGDGTIDTSKISQDSPFPAKPLSSAPRNWELIKSPDAPTFKETVELRPGKTVPLEIAPHVLVPISDGSNYFSILEPSFDALQGYRQNETVNAILSKSIDQLDEDSKQLSNALSDLHLLLASLPTQEAPAQKQGN